MLSHIHTHVGFLYCMRTDIMIFILCKLYILFPNLNPTPKPNPYRKHSFCDTSRPLGVSISPRQPYRPVQNKHHIAECTFNQKQYCFVFFSLVYGFYLITVPILAHKVKKHKLQLKTGNKHDKHYLKNYTNPYVRKKEQTHLLYLWLYYVRLW